MYKAKAMRSSWESVVVGLNFFFCFSPTTSASAADPSGWRDGLEDCSYLGRVGTCGHIYRSCHYAVSEALFRTPCIAKLDLPFPVVIVRALFCSISMVS